MQSSKAFSSEIPISERITLFDIHFLPLHVYSSEVPSVSLGFFCTLSDKSILSSEYIKENIDWKKIILKKRK